MKKEIIAATLLAALFAAACRPEPKQVSTGDEYDIPTAAVPSEQELIRRGKYLVSAVGCSDCHSPKVMTEHGPEPDPTRLLSGHDKRDALPPLEKNAGKNGWVWFAMDLTAAAGPWGVTYAANLTPDDTGIGAWTFENFKTAIRKGKYKGMEGSRDLLPPMPWQMYKNFSDDDLRSIFAYLKSLPKVENLVPAPIPPTDY
jgi:hypothetical protein